MEISCSSIQDASIMKDDSSDEENVKNVTEMLLEKSGMMRSMFYESKVGHLKSIVNNMEKFIENRKEIQ